MVVMLLAVGAGAAFGAWLRWGLALWLNPVSGALPLGTLAANLVGGYAVGVAVSWFAQHPEWNATWRLFAITGLLGGLTTFSTFSAEVIGQLQQGRTAAAALTSLAHLAGSLVMTWLGVLTVQSLRP
jgi:CrcB protein